MNNQSSTLASIVGVCLIMSAPGAPAWAQVARGANVTAHIVSPLSTIILKPVFSPTAEISLSPTSPHLAPPSVATHLSAAEQGTWPTLSAQKAAALNLNEAVQADSLVVFSARSSALIAAAAGPKDAAIGSLLFFDGESRLAPGTSGAPVTATIPTLVGAARLSRGAGESGSRIAAVPLFAFAGFLAASPKDAVAFSDSLHMIPLVLISMIIHEINHAKAANRLGDPTAMLQGRASFHPLRWHAHIDFGTTILLPLATMIATQSFFFLGAAKPVPISKNLFARPIEDMAEVALAGPKANIVLAVTGAFAHAVAVAAGLTLGSTALAQFVFINVLLATFNLIPIRPLDGSAVLKHWMPGLSARFDSLYAGLDALSLEMAVHFSNTFGLRLPRRLSNAIAHALMTSGVYLPVAAAAILGGGLIVSFSLGFSRLLIDATLWVI